MACMFVLWLCLFQDDQRGKLKLLPEYILVSVSIADDKRVLSNLGSPWVVRSREMQYESPLGFTALNLLQDLDAWTPLPMKHSGIWGSPAISSCMLGHYWRTSKKHARSLLSFILSQEFKLCAMKMSPAPSQRPGTLQQTYLQHCWRCSTVQKLKAYWCKAHESEGGKGREMWGDSVA